jgi:hypothetical protein
MGAKLRFLGGKPAITSYAAYAASRINSNLRSSTKQLQASATKRSKFKPHGKLFLAFCKMMIIIFEP